MFLIGFSVRSFTSLTKLISKYFCSYCKLDYFLDFVFQFNVTPQKFDWVLVKLILYPVLFICLFERQSDRGRGGIIFGQTKTNSESRTPSRSPSGRQGPRHLGRYLLSPRFISRKLNQSTKYLRLQSGTLIHHVAVPNVGLTCCATMPILPQQYFDTVFRSKNICAYTYMYVHVYNRHTL